MFWDRQPNRTTDYFQKVVTPATFWSLFSGVATPAQAASQVAAFLVPSVHQSNQSFASEGQGRLEKFVTVLGGSARLIAVVEVGAARCALILPRRSIDGRR